MDAIELLTRDHDKVRELFRKFNGGGGLMGLVRRTTGTVAPRERRTALARIRKELELHTLIEERIFYPAVQKLEDEKLGEMVREALGEHAKVKQQLGQLRGRKGDEDGVAGLAQALEQCVEHHASEEEKEMFPRIEELMPSAARRDLARRMRSLKQAAPTTARRTDKGPSVPRGRARATAGTRQMPGRKRSTRKASSAKTAKPSTPHERRAGQRP